RPRASCRSSCRPARSCCSRPAPPPPTGPPPSGVVASVILLGDLKYLVYRLSPVSSVATPLAILVPCRREPGVRRFIAALFSFLLQQREKEPRAAMNRRTPECLCARPRRCAA